MTIVLACSQERNDGFPGLGGGGGGGSDASGSTGTEDGAGNDGTGEGGSTASTDSPGADTDTGGGTPTSGGWDTSGPEGTDGDSGSDDEPPVKFDTPDGGGAQMGCEKVDFLFVIDSSASMGWAQQRLTQAFPRFIDTIKAELTGQDYQIMVVDSDAGEQTEYCEADCGFGSLNCGSDYPCGIDATLGACDRTLGAGITRPYGANASNRECQFDTGDRFMTDAQNDLEGAFACAATVGTQGAPWELPMSAMEAAVSDALVGPGGCNEGFVRDDAVLVVTVITDDTPWWGTDDNTGVVGTPAQWRDSLLQAKSGNADAVVALGLIPDGIDDSCIVDPATPRFIDFIDSFGDRGIVGNVCAPDYDAFFDEAVALIDNACDEFDPVG